MPRLLLPSQTVLAPTNGSLAQSTSRSYSLVLPDLYSRKPTALDALVFAYLHTLLHSNESTRIQVARRPNLIVWERTVRTQVQAAFCLPPTAS